MQSRLKISLKHVIRRACVTAPLMYTYFTKIIFNYQCFVRLIVQQRSRILFVGGTYQAFLKYH